MFKLWSDLGTNSNDIASLVIETKKKKKMSSFAHSIDNQMVILNNIKPISKKLYSRQNKPTRVSHNNATIIDHLKGTLLQI